MIDSYLVLKSLHLIAVISWMAGLLYLPRIYVYHVENVENLSVSQIFKTMERKLYFFIMYPAMVLSLFVEPEPHAAEPPKITIFK